MTWLVGCFGGSEKRGCVSWTWTVLDFFLLWPPGLGDRTFWNIGPGGPCFPGNFGSSLKMWQMSLSGLVVAILVANRPRLLHCSQFTVDR